MQQKRKKQKNCENVISYKRKILTPTWFRGGITSPVNALHSFQINLDSILNTKKIITLLDNILKHLYQIYNLVFNFTIMAQFMSSETLHFIDLFGRQIQYSMTTTFAQGYKETIQLCIITYQNWEWDIARVHYWHYLLEQNYTTMRSDSL